MLRLRVKSSLSASRTAVMSPFTSSRLMMSSTRAELIFTLADWPFALAWKMKRGREEKHWGKSGDWSLRQIISNQVTHIHANRTTGGWTHVNSSLSNLLTDLLPSWWHRACCMQRGSKRCWGPEAVNWPWRWPRGGTWPVAPGTDTAGVAACSTP